MRYINTDRILVAQLTTPAENPLVGDDTRLIDVWPCEGNALAIMRFPDFGRPV